jgi:hypothetical protein
MLTGPMPLDALTIRLVPCRMASAAQRDATFALRKVSGNRLRRLAGPSSECDGVRCEYGTPADLFL